MKNYILEIGAQISALKNHVKYEVSTSTNQTDTTPLNLSKTVNAQLEVANTNFELLYNILLNYIYNIYNELLQNIII